MQCLALVPMLQTQNMERYKSVLGFTPSKENGHGWCRLSRDQVSIMFMQNDHLASPYATAIQYIYVDDVLALWSSIKDHCTAEWGPEEMPYGMLEFAIKDPNGYLLGFGQKVP
jgi:hypothetical protein